VTSEWKFDLFIDGRWDPGEGGADPLEVVNPATEEVVGVVARASVKDAARAVSAARRAFDEGPWPWMKPAERAAALRRMAQALYDRSDELRELALAETGMAGPMREAMQATGPIGMFESNADLIEHSFDWFRAGAPSAGSSTMSGSAELREPMGVVAGITPFNWPFLQACIKSAPAMAAGCSVVLKPHPWTPLGPMLVAQAAEEAGIPPGVINIVPGGADVGAELTTNELVDMVAVTGSTANGRTIMAAAAATVKKVQLELGGKSAQVVLDDVTEEYVRSIGLGDVLLHCGQSCAACSRLLLPERFLDAYKDGVEAAKALVRIGNPADAATTLGPLIREQQRERVNGLVHAGIAEGAELLCGAKRPDHLSKGYFYEPTVLVGTNEMQIAREEIFGPVLTVIPYSGRDEDAVRMANDSIHGLAGTVYAATSARAFDVARRIRAGVMGAVGVAQLSTPLDGPGGGQGPGWGSSERGVGQDGAFGGFKQSGIGREFGQLGLEAYTDVKWIRWT
jgi:aldehyde dehydrogenase (NAD+)